MKKTLKKIWNYIFIGIGSFFICIIPFEVSGQIATVDYSTQGIEQNQGGIDTTAAENADQAVATEIGIDALFNTVHYFEAPSGKMHIIFMASLTEGNNKNGYAQVGYTFNSKITSDEKKTLLDSLPGTKFKVFELSKFESVKQYKDSIKYFWIENAYDITGIDKNIMKEFNVLVFPNPTSGSLTVKSAKGLSHITLYDIWGRKVFDTNALQGNRTIQLDIPSLQTGMYILRAFGLKGKVISTKKIIKN